MNSILKILLSLSQFQCYSRFFGIPQYREGQSALLLHVPPIPFTPLACVAASDLLPGSIQNYGLPSLCQILENRKQESL